MQQINSKLNLLSAMLSLHFHLSFIAVILYIGIFVFCFPTYMFGRSAKTVGDNSCMCGSALCFCPVHCLFARAYIRGKIREKQNITVSIASSVRGYYIYSMTACATYCMEVCFN